MQVKMQALIKNIYSFDEYIEVLDNSRFITRRTLLRLATLGTAAAFIAVWSIMTGKSKQLSGKPVVSKVNTTKLGTGIFIFDNYILVKSETSLKVLSNTCTHAGCRINNEMDGQLICPCHGSRYDAFTGKVLQGPARIPLQTIPFDSDLKTGEIIINI